MPLPLFGPGSHVELSPFSVHPVAQPGPAPDEARLALAATAQAISHRIGEARPGLVAFRFGHRVLVAPAAAPSSCVDIVDIDVPLGKVLTVGGHDPSPAGALLAQVLFSRRDMVVAYALADGVAGPTLPVLEKVLPALRGANACRIEGIGVLAVGRRPAEVAEALARLAPPPRSGPALGYGL